MSSPFSVLLQIFRLTVRMLTKIKCTVSKSSAPIQPHFPYMPYILLNKRPFFQGKKLKPPSPYSSKPNLWMIDSLGPPPPPPPTKKNKIPERWAHLDSCSFPFCVLQVKGCLAFYKSLISNAYVWEFPVNTFVNFFWRERVSNYYVIWFLVFNREFWVWLKLAPLVTMEIFTPPSCCA